MAYQTTGGLRDIIAASKASAVVKATSSTSGRIAQPAGTVVTGVTTPGGAAPSTQSKLLKWGVPLGLLAVGGFFYYRARKKQRSAP